MFLSPPFHNFPSAPWGQLALFALSGNHPPKSESAKLEGGEVIGILDWGPPGVVGWVGAERHLLFKAERAQSLPAQVGLPPEWRRPSADSGQWDGRILMNHFRACHFCRLPSHKVNIT